MPKKRQKFEEEEQYIIQALIAETDRGCVLAAHGFMDGQLKRMLHTAFRGPNGDTESLANSLLDGHGFNPFGTFSLKAKLARLLRLIDGNVFGALNALNDLRNHFAHHPGPVTLTDLRVKRIHDLLGRESKEEIAYILDPSTKPRKLIDTFHVQYLAYWSIDVTKVSEARLLFVAVADELMSQIGVANIRLEFRTDESGSR